MKKLVSIVLTLCIVTSLMISPMSAFSATLGTCGKLTWRIEGTELIISGEGPMIEEDEVFVDDFESGVGFSVKIYSWTNSRDLIEKVTIESGVTTIGDQAFVGFDKLKEVSIPDTVTRIGEQAFLGCDGIEEITIPGSVEEIWDGAFFGCTGLKTVNILPAGFEYYFYGRYIYELAFADCTGLESIDLSNNITCIDDSAFKGCTALKNVTVSDDVTYIAESAFEDCASGFTLNCPEKSYAYWYSVLIGLIEPPAFSGTIGDLTWEVKDDELVISGKGEIPDLIVVPGGTFLESFSDTWILLKKYYSKVTIKSGVTSIGELAFINCDNIKEVAIPESVTSIGNCAFEGCTSLEDVTILDSVTNIENNAFANCSSELTIHCSRNSYAYKYAIDNNIKVSVTGEVYGDADGDGVFTVDDVSYVIHFILFGTVRPEHYPAHQDMDYNKDGKVDLNDAIVLLDEILYS